MTTACSHSHPCRPETCDQQDNDCDGRVDEDFVDGSGLYVQNDHCGGCDIQCKEVLPTAATTRCELQTGVPECRIATCPPGKVPSGLSACVPELPVLCLPCAGDDECALRSPGARCILEPGGSGRCGRACSEDLPCPEGYSCGIPFEDGTAQCRPNAGSCLCGADMEGAELACDLQVDGHVCVGVQHCEGGGLGQCEPLLTESCNAQDDDCDGRVDEGFVDAQNRYSSMQNCGSCGAVCAPPGEHMDAACVSDQLGAHCDIACAAGYVNVDGLLANGCECELQDGSTVVVGGDSDCDGHVDPTPSLVFVSPGGDDSHDGTDAKKPVRTIARGLAQGLALDRQVLVARGIYEEAITVLPGVTLHGGYSPDFHEHDVELYPVLVERPGNGDGKPVLTCKDISAPTVVDGLTLVASDATTPSSGSTAMLLDDCGPAVQLSHLTVIAGRGAPGKSGDDSSERLFTLGWSSLADLAGVDGGRGSDGGDGSATTCPTIPGGAGSPKICTSNVSGGAGGAADCPSLTCDNNTSTPCGNAGCTDFTSGGVCDIAAAKAAATPNPAAVSGSGTASGAAGELTYSAPTNHDVCNFCDDNPSLPRNGDDGKDGGSGVSGAGGAACDGTLGIDASGRAFASAGGGGGNGGDGSGGGGGSAGAGYAVIFNTQGLCSSIAGGSGGGGGSGGCGAPGATGGGGGGASIAVLVRLSSPALEGPTFEALQIITGSGGDGGNGGIGASGGRGGVGAIGGDTQFWCARPGGRGGDGGLGGAGGGGGGGCGGSSIGVYVQAVAGAQPYVDFLRQVAAISVAGAAGHAGQGGFSPGHSGPSGQDGTLSDLVLVSP